MFPRGIHFDLIARQLTVLADYVRMLNKRGKTDASKLCEDFYCQIFNVVYGLDLINLNRESASFPAIDLGDTLKKVSIQVTSDKTTKKVRETIEKFDSSDGPSKFDVLKIFVIGSKQKTYPETLKSKTVDFDPKQHIFDNDDLLAQIETLDTDIVKKISKYLKDELEMKIAGSEVDPNNINEFDIKYTIDFLHSFLVNDAGAQDVNEKKYSRDVENFVSEKNKLNLLSESLFSEKITPSIVHSRLIQNFLTNPSNEESRIKYLHVADSINDLYLDSDDFRAKGIDFIFGSVFGMAMTNIDHNKSDLRLLPILEVLHNMYFHCDIGKNPDV